MVFSSVTSSTSLHTQSIKILFTRIHNITFKTTNKKSKLLYMRAVFRLRNKAKRSRCSQRGKILEILPATIELISKLLHNTTPLYLKLFIRKIVQGRGTASLLIFSVANGKASNGATLDKFRSKVIRSEPIYRFIHRASFLYLALGFKLSPTQHL